MIAKEWRPVPADSRLPRRRTARMLGAYFPGTGNTMAARRFGSGNDFAFTQPGPDAGG